MPARTVLCRSSDTWRLRVSIACRHSCFCLPWGVLQDFSNVPRVERSLPQLQQYADALRSRTNRYRGPAEQAAATRLLAQQGFDASRWEPDLSLKRVATCLFPARRSTSLKTQATLSTRACVNPLATCLSSVSVNLRDHAAPLLQLTFIPWLG